MSALAWSGLSFFLGLILGHWLAIGRDKRKEFNEHCKPIRDWVVLQLSHPNSDLQRAPSESHMDAFLQRLSRSRRSRFRDAWAETLLAYAANRRRDLMGGDTFSRSEDGLKALHKLERLTRPR